MQQYRLDRSDMRADLLFQCSLLPRPIYAYVQSLTHGGCAGSCSSWETDMARVAWRTPCRAVLLYCWIESVCVYVVYWLVGERSRITNDVMCCCSIARWSIAVQTWFSKKRGTNLTTGVKPLTPHNFPNVLSFPDYLFYSDFIIFLPISLLFEYGLNLSTNRIVVV